MFAERTSQAEPNSGVRKLSELAPSVCLHCGSPLPGERDDGFCCSGCRHVYTLLTSSGLDRYYQLRSSEPIAPVAQSMRHADHAWIDALEAQKAAGVRRVSLNVQGIQCSACVWLITTLFKRQEGALNAQLNPARGQLVCTVGEQFPLSEFVSAAEEFGYRFGPAQEGAERQATDGLLLRTGICAALAGNTMFLAAATYLGLDQGPLHTLFQNASLASASLSTLIGGSYFVDRAWASIKRGVMHLDLPIAVGMLLAYAGSVWSYWFADGAASYFDTVSVFIALMLGGRVVQERLIERNRRLLLESEGASSLIARRLSGGRTEFVPCAKLESGDQLLVCPGEIVPVRAELLSESASLGLDWINGESAPVHFKRGDQLTAGAINVAQSSFEVRALAAFQSSELDLLLRDDDSAKQRLSGDFWDLTARAYVAVVLVATAVGGLLWWLSGAGLVQTINVATAVLVVTCPCAFGIAVPLAYELGVSGLRRRGLFVRDAGFFDRAARVKRIVFDKTGTLTTGIPEVSDVRVLDGLTREERGVLYSLVARSNHPKSMAVANALTSRFPELCIGALEVREVAGKGLECSVEGRRYRFGESAWALNGTSQESGTVFSADGQLLGALALREVARPGAQAELKALEREGYELWIASGDRNAHVKELAARLGIPEERALGDLTPDDKRQLIDRLDARDTLMLGDGINDGPALSRAHCSGTPAIDRPFVPARADFYFLTPGLGPVRTALHVASGVRKTVRRALWFAGLYNVGAIALAYAGLMQPWLAAVMMPASSAAVLGFTAYSLSTRRYVWRS